MRPLSLTEMVELLDEEYYSIGIESGHEALGNLMEDFMAGRLDQNLAEWGCSKAVFPNIFFAFAKSLHASGKIWKSHQEYYSYPRRKSRWRR